MSKLTRNGFAAFTALLSLGLGQRLGLAEDAPVSSQEHRNNATAPAEAKSAPEPSKPDPKKPKYGGLSLIRDSQYSGSAVPVFGAGNSGGNGAVPFRATGQGPSQPLQGPAARQLEEMQRDRIRARSTGQ